MNGFANIVLLMLFVSGLAAGSDHAVIKSVHATQGVPLDLDPTSAFWRTSRPVYMERDGFGKIVPRYRTEVRTRWTKDNHYFLFVCPYVELHLKLSPNTQKETNELWNWDVAEVFVGSDFTNIKRYKEFEVSPQGEWVDLDIDLSKLHHEDGWTWNSGFEVKARIGEATQHLVRRDAHSVGCDRRAFSSRRKHDAGQPVSESGAAFASASGNMASFVERFVSRS